MNQCDGCRRGLPLEEELHRDFAGYAAMYCTRSLYEEAMTFNDWFESKYPRRTFSHSDAEIYNMREEYKDVWITALEAAAKTLKGNEFGPYKHPSEMIRGMIVSTLAAG
jgi:hypothetical protein